MSERKIPLQQEIMNRPLQKHGLLEEFNLPPKVIIFLRSNSRFLLAGLIFFALALVGWSYYSHYDGERNNRAADLLAGALAGSSPAEQSAAMESIVKEYGGTGAAVWAEIELGHLAFASGKYKEALGRYQGVLAGLSGKSPLAPLVQLSVAQTQENLGAMAEALAAYEKLAAMQGFAGEAYLAMARIHEGQGAVEKAREIYGKILTEKDMPAGIKELALASLARI